ncbi:MAG: transcriptional regulator [Pseudomonadota bacterium]
MTDFQTLIKQERGAKSRLARELGVTPGAVNQWRRVPAERVVEVERITGIPREQLRPDLFQKEQDHAVTTP